MAEKKTVNVYTDDQKIDSETSPINSGEPSLGTPVDAGTDAASVEDKPRGASETVSSPQPTTSGRPGWLIPLLVIALLILLFVLFF